MLERYEGRAVDVSVAIVRDKANPRRERLEVVCPPDVRLEQNVEELLFRASALYRQVHLTFESGRDRALCLHMLYGVIAGVFVEVDRAARARRRRRLRADQLPRGRVRSRRGLLPARRRSAARSCVIWPG